MPPIENGDGINNLTLPYINQHTEVYYTWFVVILSTAQHIPTQFGMQHCVLH